MLRSYISIYHALSLTRVGFFRLELSLRIMSIPPLAAIPILQHSLPKSIPITDMVLAPLFTAASYKLPLAFLQFRVLLSRQPAVHVPKEFPKRLPAKPPRIGTGPHRATPHTTGQGREAVQEATQSGRESAVKITPPTKPKHTGGSFTYTCNRLTRGVWGRRRGSCHVWP